MKRIFLFLSIVLSVSAAAQVPANYKTQYATLAGKSGVQLFDAISAIAAIGYQSHSYGDLWTYFRTTDATSDGKVWDMYSDCSFAFGTNQCGNYSGVCDCYNREHSLPKSWFGGSTSNAPGNDLFHLYPTDGKVNGDRGNLPFGECAGGLKPHYKGKVGASQLSGCSGNVFEPDDIYKGDFARSYFGMLVRYGKSFELNQAEGATMFSNTGKSITASNHYGLTTYSVDMLMRWHGLDPVSQKETDRNNGIQQTQGNRNPFIDCPVLAEYFWGAKAGDAVELQDLVDCGCADDNGGQQGTAIEENAFPSLTLTLVGTRASLTCVPEGGQVAVVNAVGKIINLMSSCQPEVELTLPQGFYMIVVAAHDQQRAFKVLVK